MTYNIPKNNNERSHKDAVIQFFDTEYHWWDTIYDEKKHPNFLSFEMRKRKKIVINLIETNVKKNAHILESGCGSGDIMTDVAKLGYTVTGVDINYRLLSIARNHLLDCTLSSSENGKEKTNLIQSDVEQLPFQNSSFDVVYCVGVLSYLQGDYKTVNEISRVVKTGGIVLIALPNLFPIYKFPDPYYYLIGISKYILRNIRIRKKIQSKSNKNMQFKSTMIRHYYYGQFSNLFKSTGLDEIGRINVSFGPFTFWLKEIFSLPLSIKISEYLVKIAQKKYCFFFKYIANRWVICLQKK